MDRSQRADYFNYMRALRRVFHAYPEPGFAEFRTQNRICSELDKLGVAYKRVSTGVIAEIPGKNHASRIAFRADMDALPIEEANAVEYRSQNPGYMHACGHDGHMANLLALAKYYSATLPPRDVRLIFQPAEEGEGGALTMIQGGALEGVAEIYALHVDPGLPAGCAGVCGGPDMAGAVEFDVEIAGRSAHAAQPGNGIDALRAANAFLDHLYRVASRLDRQRLLLHAGSLTAGSARNVIAGSARIDCTFRYFDECERDRIMAGLKSYLARLDAKYKTRSELAVKAVYVPVVNDPGLAARVTRCAQRIPGMSLAEEHPRFTAEDFAFYEKKAPGCLLWLGVGDGRGARLHAPTFDFHEEALLYGLQLFIQLTEFKE